MTFNVGQKVVCIDQPRTHMMARFPGSNWPRKNGVYTIRAINEWPDGTLLRFSELDNRHFEGVISTIEPGFDARHFRPIVERKTDISIFTAMLTDKKVDA